MSYIYRDGKVKVVSLANIKLPKKLIKEVDNNERAKELVKKAIESVKKSKVEYAF